jgi:hypothetical protein
VPKFKTAHHPLVRSVPAHLFPSGCITLIKLLRDAMGPNARRVADGDKACPICVLHELEPVFNLKLHHKVDSTVGGDDLFTEAAFVVVTELVRPLLLERFDTLKAFEQSNGKHVKQIIDDVTPQLLAIKPIAKRLDKTKSRLLTEVAISSYVHWLKSGKPELDDKPTMQ